ILNIPGTGPFKTKRRVENEIWVMEKNPNYWNKGLPYLDGIEVYHLLPFSPDLGSAILSGRVDYARALDPVTARKAAAISEIWILNIPGTGPFKTKRRVENEIWVMEKNPNYWNKGLPYLDGIEVYHLLPFSPDLGSAILSGRVDYARALDPVTARKAAAISELSTAKFYQSVIHATWLNAKRKPFDDPRVRRAMHLLFEKDRKSVV